MPRIPSFLIRGDRRGHHPSGKKPGEPPAVPPPTPGRGGKTLDVPQRVRIASEAVSVDTKKCRHEENTNKSNLPIYAKYTSTTPQLGKRSNEDPGRSRALRRKTSMSMLSVMSIRNPFRSSVEDSPAVLADVAEPESPPGQVTIGNVDVHKMQVTNPVAPYMGLPARAEVMLSPKVEESRASAHKGGASELGEKRAAGKASHALKSNGVVGSLIPSVDELR
ncbi:hypothetical protein DENSPDRAFT_929425 [Dentipellis sp. KUC8613]|nr:hypothetical protein DENSPDRAFT_929425 [Dentipellis sp. KUC8613]